MLGPVALLLGLRAAPSASVSLWLNLETTATALLAWAFFREHIGPRVALANALVLGAGVMLASPGGFSFGPSALLIGLACLCWGLDNNLTAVIDGYTPEQTTVAKGLVAGSLNLGLGLWLEGAPPTVGHALAGLAVGALAYGASIVLYIRGAQQLGAARSQMWFSTPPLFGVGAAWLLLASEEAVKKYGLQPIGKITDTQWAGLDPAQMGLGPVSSGDMGHKRGERFEQLGAHIVVESAQRTL